MNQPYQLFYTSRRSQISLLFLVGVIIQTSNGWESARHDLLGNNFVSFRFSTTQLIDDEFDKEFEYPCMPVKQLCSTHLCLVNLNIFIGCHLAWPSVKPKTK